MRLRSLPAGQLVRPERVHVQATCALGLLAAQANRPGAVGPAHAAFGRFKLGPIPRRCNGEQPGGPLHQHIADVVGRGRDQAAKLHRTLLDPFLDPRGPSSCLAGPAPRHVSPNPPVARRRSLCFAPPGMLAAFPGRQPAGAVWRVPAPRRAVGDNGESLTRQLGLRPLDPRVHAAHQASPRPRPGELRARCTWKR